MKLYQVRSGSRVRQVVDDEPSGDEFIFEIIDGTTAKCKTLSGVDFDLPHTTAIVVIESPPLTDETCADKSGHYSGL